MTGRGQWCNHATWYGPVCPFCIAAGEVARPAYRHPRRTRITLALYRRRRWGIEPIGLLDSLQSVTSRYGALQRTVGDVDNLPHTASHWTRCSCWWCRGEPSQPHD